MKHESPRITFRIERDVVLDAHWFDQQLYDDLRGEGLSHEDTLRQQVEMAIEDDLVSFLWASFGPFAGELATSITHLDLVDSDPR